MSCHGCADAFGFWKREIGCPNCGYSYCQKCLRYKITVPDPENKAILEKVVCSKCYMAATEKKESHLNPASTGQQAIAAAKAVEVLETLDNPTKHPITVYCEERFSNLKRGLSTEDQKLVDRLEGLRNFNKDSGGRRTSDQPDQDIAARLAKLKGMEYTPSSENSSILLKQKPQTEDDLLKQFSDEVTLNKEYDDNFVSDLEARLAKLRGGGSSDSEKSTPASGLSSLPAGAEKSEDDQVNDIINRYMKEVELEAKLKADGGDDEEEESAEGLEDDLDDVDKLCRICDEKRAIILCKECDGDIFCKKCFIEFHEEIGESHKPYPVKSSSQDEEDY